LKIIKLAVALLMTAWVSSANASLIFDFAFTDANNNVLVTGEIFGLENDATGTASGITLLTNNVLFPFADLLDDANDVLKNVFTVSDNKLTSANFNIQNNTNGETYLISAFYLEFNPTLTMNNVQIQMLWRPQLDNVQLSGTFDAVLRQVPAPSTIILLSLGIAGLFLSRHRRKY
jgi:hypothetical protein